MHGPHIPPPIPFATPAPAPVPLPTNPPRVTVPGKPGIKPGEEPGGLRLLTYLRLHWLMILFCGTLLGGAGAFAAWELLASKYESYALLQVSSVPDTVANQNNPSQARTDFVTYLKTTSALIKSEFVLNAALRDLKDCPTIRAQKDPIKFLDEELLVAWQDGSEVIRITFKSHEPADAKKIVDAVLNAFTREVIQKDVQLKQSFLRKVEEAQLEMRKILDRKAEKPALAKGQNPPPGVAVPAGGVPNPMPPAPLPALPGADPVAPAAPGAPPGLPAVPGAVSAAGFDRAVLMDPRILVNKVASLQSEAERLPLTINDGKRRLVVLQKKMDAIKDAPISQMTLDAVEKDQEVIVQILKWKQATREYEFRYNAATDKTAPGILELKAALQAHEAKLAQIRKEKADTIERAQRVAEAQKIATEMEDLIRGLQRQQEQLETVKSLLGRAEKQLAELPLPGEKGMGIMQIDGKEPIYRPEGSDLESTDSIYRQLVQQYYRVQMELNSPTRVQVLQQGSTPTQKEIKKQIIGTIFAGLLGFALMGLGVVTFETVAKRVSSLADVKGTTGVPVVGVIPCQPGEAMGKDPVKRAAASEAIDKLRAYVSQSWLSRGATTVAVTSPLSNEGKAFTAFGLASSLAQSGYKTLLVDFDLRDPELHELAGVANQNGMCELLRAEIDARAAVQFLPSGLHLIPAGKWSDEARKAATGEKLETLLAKLKGPYDCVILHGHALLTAAEAVEVARRCEVVLVCALYRQTTMPLLKRAAERVATMEIPHSGIVYVGASEEESLC